MKTLKLKAGKNVVTLSLTVTPTNCFHLIHGQNILCQGWIDSGRFGVDSMSRELAFFEDQVREFLTKNLKNK